MAGNCLLSITLEISWKQHNLKEKRTSSKSHKSLHTRLRFLSFAVSEQNVGNRFVEWTLTSRTCNQLFLLSAVCIIIIAFLRRLRTTCNITDGSRHARAITACPVESHSWRPLSSNSRPVLIGGPGWGQLFCEGAHTTRKKRINPSFRQNSIYNFNNFDWVVKGRDTLFLPFHSEQNHCKKSVIVLLMQTPCQGATGGYGGTGPCWPPLEPPSP